MTVLDAQPAAGPTPERECPVVAGLRHRRQALLAEDRRASYLRRLVRAHLDLTVAGTLGVPELEGLVGEIDASGLTGVVDLVPWTSIAACGPTGSGTGPDLVDRLRGLDLALDRLDAYSDVLHAEIDRSTAQLVEALRQRPRAGLDRDPRPAA